MHCMVRPLEAVAMMKQQEHTDPCRRGDMARSCALQALLKDAAADMVAACRRGLVHGLLVMLRYVMPAVPWEGGAEHVQALQTWLAELLQLLDSTAEVAMPPLCHPRAGFSGEASLKMQLGG